MSAFVFTITVTLEADDHQDAWDQWTDLLTQPRFVEDNTFIDIDTEGVTEPLTFENEPEPGDDPEYDSNYYTTEELVAADDPLAKAVGGFLAEFGLTGVEYVDEDTQRGDR